MKVQPFRPKAGNKTALVVTKKGQDTKYPIPYFIYEPFAAFDQRIRASWHSSRFLHVNENKSSSTQSLGPKQLLASGK